MDKPFDYIFIDTSVFMRAPYFQKGGCVDRLFDLANKGFVRILMPAITEREWWKHFDEGVRLKFDEIERKSRLLGLDETKAFLEKHDGISKEYDSLVKKSFKDHMDGAKVIKLDLDYPSDYLKIVLEKYFDQEKPFGPKGKVKEFPDAFILASLEKYAKVHGIDKIIVFACDGDMQEYVSPVLQPQDTVEYLNDVATVKMPTFLKEETEKVEKDTSRLYQYIGYKPEPLLNQICNKVEEFLSDVNNYEERFNYVEIDEAYVDELSLDSSVKDMEIHSIEEDVMTALFFVDVDASIRVRHFDEEESIWDSEDQKYIHQEFKTTVLNIASTVAVTINFDRTIMDIQHEHIAEITDVDMDNVQDAINDDGWCYESFDWSSMGKLTQMAQAMRRTQKLFKMPTQIQEAISSMQSLQQFNTPTIVEQLQEVQMAISKMSETIKQLQQMSMPARKDLTYFVGHKKQEESQ